MKEGFKQLVMSSDHSNGSGYCLLGVVNDKVNPHDSLVILYRFNQCDDHLWSRLISYPGLCPSAFSGNGARSIGMTNDGGVIFGFPGNFCSSTSKIILVKVDINGNIVLNKFIELDQVTQRLAGSFGLCTLNDGDFLLFSISQNGSFVYRLDPNLNIRWGKIYDFDMNYYLPTADEGLVMYSDSKILKINSNGDVIFSKSIQGGFRIHDITEVSDGIVLLDIHYRINSGTTINNYMSLLKIGNDGKIKWQNDPFWYRNSSPERTIESAAITAIGDDIYVAAQFYFGPFLEKMIISKLDGNGRLILNQRLAAEVDLNFWYLSDIQPHPVSGLMIFGSNYNYRSNPVLKPRRYISKLDDDLFVNSCYFEPNSPPEDTALEKAILVDGIKSFLNVTLNSITEFTMKISEVNVTTVPACELDNPIGLSNDTTLCFGKYLVLKSQCKFDTYQWSTGETTRSIIVFKPGKYFVTAKNSCEEVSDTIVVNYHPDPKVSFLVEPQAASIFEDVHFTSNTPTPGRVSWRIGVGYPIDEDEFSYQYPLNGIYNIKYVFTDDFGCRFTDSTDLKIYTLNISIPNTFTPNGDNLNETFAPVGFGVKSFKMTIFNRWGGIAYEGYEPWNGGEAPSGVYVYQMEITDDFNEVKKETGKVLLNR